MAGVPEVQADDPRFPALQREDQQGCGKLTRAVYVIRKYPEELEADLLQHFGVDFLDLWRGRLSLRRVSVLINSLLSQPGRSVLAAAADESAVWGESEYLLARVSDALELSNYLFYQANSGEDADDWPIPVPLQRPGTDPIPEPEPAHSHASTEEVIDFFNRMNNLL
ncbi:hypothetical protein ACWEVY_28655 [Streptomyces longwoodensis]